MYWSTQVIRFPFGSWDRLLVHSDSEWCQLQLYRELVLAIHGFVFHGYIRLSGIHGSWVYRAQDSAL